MTAALVGGAVLVALGSLAATSPRRLRAGLMVQAVGALAIGVAGAWSVWDEGSAGSSFTGAFEPRLGLDPLSGAFLLVVGLVGAPALAFASGYLRPSGSGRATAVLCGPFVLALVGVVCARDPLTFLVCWELMTLLPAAIILLTRHDDGARRAVFVYVAITHLGGVGVWVAMLLLADAGALAGAPLAEGSALQVAVALAGLVGFGTKAGLMPLHAWLPRAHPLAPAPISALMSGSMVAVALYGLTRLLVDWLGPVPVWIGCLVLALGAISALGGVVYAVFQGDLKRLLAFSTIENVGIALLGLGAYVVLRERGDAAWASIALGASLLHLVNHAAAKGAFFLGAGAIERATGTVELDALGGVLRRMPWTGAVLLIGSLALAGVPPLNGFASEWLTLQALLHVPAAGGVADGLVGAVALGALAAAAALAVLCFVKVAGSALLGPPTRHVVERARDPEPALRVALGALAGACVVLALIPGVLLSRLAAVAPGAAPPPAHAGLRLPSTGDLPTPGIAVVLLVLTGVLVLARGRRSAAPAPTWACGQEIDPSLSWTGAGFTKSARLVLEAVLRPEREVVVESRSGVVQSVAYTGRVPHLVDERLYRPVTRLALGAAATARRLQSGRLGTYVAYLVALVVVLLAAVRTGVLG